jgi:hypothetical protein
MMNSSIVTAVITAVLASLISMSSAVADGKPQEVKRFDQACGSDIKEYCSRVEPGDGRISACLYAHTPTLTDECYVVTEQVGLVLESVFDGIEALYAACSGDLREFCSDKQPGSGEILACLRENRANISAGCNVALPSYGSSNP